MKLLAAVYWGGLTVGLKVGWCVWGGGIGLQEPSH